MNLILISLSACSIPKSSHKLIPPAGHGKAEWLETSKQCMQESSKLSLKPLTKSESQRIGNIETCRFHEGGRGRSISCDRKILCYLNRDYQLLEYPVVWFSQSTCERLDTYKSAGIEKERLKDLCKTLKADKCVACKSLQ